MDPNGLEMRLMGNIFLEAKLSERYTNHCIGPFKVTALFQGNVDAQKICKIT